MIQQVLCIFIIWGASSCRGEAVCSLHPIPVVQNQTNHLYIPAASNNNRFLERYYDIKCDYWYRSDVESTYVQSPPWLCMVNKNQVLHDIYTTTGRLDVDGHSCGGCTSLLGSYILLMMTALWIISTLVITYCHLFVTIQSPHDINVYVIDAVYVLAFVPCTIIGVILLVYKPLSRVVPVCHNGSVIKDIMVEPHIVIIMIIILLLSLVVWCPYMITRYEHFTTTLPAVNHAHDSISPGTERKRGHACC
jgi:hypothetical protein